jgi:two-component system, chemotaxis family, chemotaxis protein CheY
VRILITDDDFTCRRLLQAFLAPYGDCDIAVNGEETIEALKLAWKEGRPYELLCLDIMMPGMDGQETLSRIRDLENARGVPEVKIIMTTALNDSKNILKAFRSQCEAYLVKPISRDMLEKEMRALGFLAPQPKI